MRSRVAFVEGMRNIFKTLVGRPEVKGPILKPRHKRMILLRFILKEHGLVFKEHLHLRKTDDYVVSKRREQNT
jgi:hypothetical protein